MTKAVSTPTTSRRKLFGSTAAISLAGALPAMASQAAHPDQELIATCAAFSAADREYQAIYEAVEDDEAACVAATAVSDAQLTPLINRMLVLRAKTPEGIAARAKTLGLYNGHGEFSLDIDHSTCAGRQIIGLLRDVLEMNGLPVPAALVGGAV